MAGFTAREIVRETSTERTKRLKERYLDAELRLDLTWPLLITDYFKRTEGQPIVERRAGAFRYAIEKSAPIIRDDELIVGSQSRHIRVVVPYRNPVVLAKQVATVDFLSGGRFLFGVGVGHAKGEFDAIGVSHADREARTNEYLEAMVELWTKDEPRFAGRFVQFADIAFEPKPAQKPHPPILMGGNSKPAMRRAAKYADGWLPWLITRDQLPECLEYIRSRPEFDQRQRTRPFEVVMPVSPIKVEDYSHKIVGETTVPLSRNQLIDEIGEHERAGVTVMQAAPPRTRNRAHFLEWIQWFAEEVMPAFRGGPRMSTDQS